MNKPTLQTRIEKFYNWNDCVKYIEEKHNCNIRDFAGIHGSNNSTGEYNSLAPYQDYWHFVVERTDLRRDEFFYMENEWLEDVGIDEWQATITGWFLEEFGEGEYREIQFWAEW